MNNEELKAVLAFADNHWFLAWCALWLCWMPIYLLGGCYKFACYVLRYLLIAVRGWPPSHLDADGDFKKVEK